MRNQLKKLALATLLALIVLVMPSLAQQNSLLQTTLAAAVPSTPSTDAFHSSQTFITVASVPTGVTGISLNPTTTLNRQSQWFAYIDREYMAVVAINGTVVQVQRGQSSTVAQPHANGAMVLFGRGEWFYPNDPGGTPGAGTGISGTSCTPAQVFVTPYLNIKTGAQWICSSITGTWVAGWNNGVAVDWAGQTATVAAAAGTVLPSGPNFIISGAGAITGFTIPLGFPATSVNGACFNVTAASGSTWTWTAAGNISLAGTGTALKGFTFCWVPSISKFVPSSVS